MPRTPRLLVNFSNLLIRLRLSRSEKRMEYKFCHYLHGLLFSLNAIISIQETFLKESFCISYFSSLMMTMSVKHVYLILWQNCNCISSPLKSYYSLCETHWKSLFNYIFRSNEAWKVLHLTGISISNLLKMSHFVSVKIKTFFRKNKGASPSQCHKKSFCHQNASIKNL